MTQSESTADSIRRIVDEIDNFDVESDLIRTLSLGDWAFKELRNEFIQMKLLLSKLRLVELTIINHSILSELSRELKGLLLQLNSIAKFDVAHDRADQTKTNLIRSFTEQFIRIIDISVKVFLLSSLQKNQSEEPRQILESEKLEAKIKEAESKLTTAVAEMESALAVVRSKSKEIGVERYSLVFSTESKKNLQTSIVWLVSTILLLTAGLAYGYVLLKDLEELGTHAIKSKLLSNNNFVVQITIIRLLTITILFYALSICMKNYRAQKHNQIINRHRSNALITFETFNAGATDEGTKNAVLLEATRAIFRNQPTGFSSKDSDIEGPTNQVIEILKTRTSAKSAEN